jgi:hypothetical protein
MATRRRHGPFQNQTDFPENNGTTTRINGTMTRTVNNPVVILECTNAILAGGYQPYTISGHFSVYQRPPVEPLAAEVLPR